VFFGVFFSGHFLLICTDSNQWEDPIQFSGTPGVDFPYGNLHSTVQLADGTVLYFGGKANGYSKDLWLFRPSTFFFVPLIKYSTRISFVVNVL
jgi:hypothetical protein